MRRNQRRTISNPAAGLIALVVVVILTYLGFTKAIPFQHHFTIHAAFRTANNIRKGSPVRIAGVNVGKVTGVRPLSTGNGGGAAIVDMRIDDNGLPIHTDAQAAIRPRIFLEGNFFVDLKPGTPESAKLGDGGTLPIQNDTSPVQLDQILTGLQADTRHSLQRLIEEYAKGLSGPGGQGFNASIKYWTPAYRDSAVVNDATQGTQPGDLQGYIRYAAGTAAALDRNPPQLQSLITDFSTTARAFGANQSALEQAIAELPRTLHAAVPALVSLNNAFPSVRRFVADFRPAVRSSGPALDASIPFAQQLRGLVSKPELRGLSADLVPTIPALAQLNAQTVPLLEQNRLASSCVNQVVLPWSHETVPDPNFPATGDVSKEGPKPLVGLAGESRTGDANGFWFRILLNAGNSFYQLKPGSFVSLAFPLLGTNPPAAKVRPPLRPDVPCETQTPPSLATVPGSAPQKMQVDQSSARYQAIYNAARTGFIKYLQGLVAKAGVKGVSVSPNDITGDQISQLAAQAGHTVQLSQVANLLRGHHTLRGRP